MEHSEPIESVDLLLEHAGWLRRLARDLVHDAHTADDLVQDTWLAFLRARPGTGRPLRPWLAGVARNAAALRRRRASNRAAREADTARGEALPSTGELIERAEVQQDLARGVLALDEPYRGVILLRFYEGLTPKQIADARGVPAATVRSQLHRGLAQLRERLDARHDGDRRAWMALLSPLALRVENEAGASVVAATAAAALVVVAAVAGAFWLGGGEDRAPAVEGPTIAAASVDDAVPLGSPDANGRAPVPADEVAAAPATRAWTLVDERTGAPLADYAVRVGEVLARADAAGVVELPATARELVPVDDPAQAVRERVGHTEYTERAPDRGEVRLPAAADADRIALATGPTLTIDAGATDVTGWRAELQRADDARGPLLVAPVRAGASRAAEGGAAPWVRFSGWPGAAPEGADELVVRVRDAAGYRAGAARFGVADARVEPALRRTGVVEGRVAGLPPSAPGAVVLLALERRGTADTDATDAGDAADGEGDTRDAAPPIACAPDATGAFRLAWIEPGAYRLSVRAAGQSPWSVDVDVRADETARVDETFDAAPTAGPVAGAIESASGTYGGQLLVFLRDADGVVHGVFPTTWKAGEDGALRADFRFDPVPAGELSLDVVSLQDAAVVDVDPARFRAPQGDVRVRVRDDRAAADWRFDVVDAETGAALDAFTATARFDGGAERRFVAGPPADPDAAARTFTLQVGGMRWNCFESAAPLRALPADARFDWTITADGYAPASGTHADFDVEDEGGRAVRVALRRE